MSYAFDRKCILGRYWSRVSCGFLDHPPWVTCPVFCRAHWFPREFWILFYVRPRLCRTSSSNPSLHSGCDNLIFKKPLRPTDARVWTHWAGGCSRVVSTFLSFFYILLKGIFFTISEMAASVISSVGTITPLSKDGVDGGVVGDALGRETDHSPVLPPKTALRRRPMLHLREVNSRRIS